MVAYVQKASSKEVLMDTFLKCIGGIFCVIFFVILGLLYFFPWTILVIVGWVVLDYGMWGGLLLSVLTVVALVFDLAS